MTATRVKSELSYKLNIGNYESFDILVGIEADAMEGESAVDAEKRVSDLTEAILMERVTAAANQFIHNKKKPVEG